MLYKYNVPFSRKPECSTQSYTPTRYFRKLDLWLTKRPSEERSAFIATARDCEIDATEVVRSFPECIFL